MDQAFFGRNWLEKIKLDWTSIYSLQESLSVTKLLERQATLFSDMLGALQSTTAQLFINPQARPRYFKDRPVPYRLKEKVEMELSRLQELHVIAPVQHADWTTTVLTRLSSVGLTLKHSKCLFASTSVEYLGHIIDSSSLHPSKAKVEAVKEAPAPTTVTELRAFLGLIDYYHKFLPNLSTVLALLHALLCKGAVRTWSKAQDKAFQQVKEVLRSSLLLVHFDSQKPLILSCDASPYGLRVVLAHQMPDGSEKL